ncbi:MerR family transcriptional regulator [Ferruginibacter albus]|uniref:MerR family transcriptional regulator n=1 Tax=Ferruginibacter albus TaxID=2875540 RepID=UPI001CC6BA24|nr:MerR family transcriptional regulator [Ferruginibacter albus]UAY51856.1 MerR family transcriptional regulator [Ferruginibacter albus]
MPLQQIAFDFDAPPVEKEPEKKVVDKKVEEEKAKVESEKPKAETKKQVVVKQKKSTRGRKSLKEIAITADLIEVPEDEILFQKMYYSIGDVARMFKVNQSQIRFWENEFTVLKPKKNGKGDRLFRPEDIKNLQMIHHLVREKKYTMEGAKDFFKNNKKAEEKFAVIESLKKIKAFLNELKANL